MEFMVSDSQTVVYINYSLVTKSTTISFYVFFFFFTKKVLCPKNKDFLNKSLTTLLHWV